jgi:hypothetical protein
MARLEARGYRGFQGFPLSFFVFVGMWRVLRPILFDIAVHFDFVFESGHIVSASNHTASIGSGSIYQLNIYNADSIQCNGKHESGQCIGWHSVFSAKACKRMF